jgi:hypothetical protein
VRIGVILAVMGFFQRQFDQRKPRPSRLVSAIDKNPRGYIIRQIVWIATSVVMLCTGLAWIAKGLRLGDLDDLLMGVWLVPGAIGVVTGFVNVNWTLKRIEAKLHSNSEPDGNQHTPIATLDTL